LAGIHWFGPGGSGVDYPPTPPVGPSMVENFAGHLPGANPLMGLLGGHPQIGGHMQALGGLAAIIHNLLGGGGAPLGGIAHQIAPASGGLPGQFTPGAPTPPPGVTAPPAGSYNPAQYYRATGHPQYGAELWESHHPYAVQHGHVPHWVAQALLHAIQNVPGAQAPAPPPPPAPSNQIQ
jgi:hypothetical protein